MPNQNTQSLHFWAGWFSVLQILQFVAHQRLPGWFLPVCTHLWVLRVRHKPEKQDSITSVVQKYILREKKKSITSITGATVPDFLVLDSAQCKTVPIPGYCRSLSFSISPIEKTYKQEVIFRNPKHGNFSQRNCYKRIKISWKMKW